MRERGGGMKRGEKSKGERREREPERERDRERETERERDRERETERERDRERERSETLSSFPQTCPPVEAENEVIFSQIHTDQVKRKITQQEPKQPITVQLSTTAHSSQPAVQINTLCFRLPLFTSSTLVSKTLVSVASALQTGTLHSPVELPSKQHHFLSLADRCVWDCVVVAARS